MGCFGTRGSAGFSIAGLPDLRRVVVLLVWESEQAAAGFLECSPLARAWRDATRHAWHVRAEVLAARGSHRGAQPFADAATSAAGARSANGGPVAVLTLGRTKLRRMLTFARISPPAEPFLTTDGLIAAVSAGLPVAGNCTFTLWESEEAMLRFAYEHPPGDHRETLRNNRRKSVLVEQLSARFTPTHISGTWDAHAPNSQSLSKLATTLR